MANGKWTRHGRGDCEGYVLFIGYGFFSFRAGVTRNIRTPERPLLTWRADLYGRTIADDLPDRDTGLDKVEAELRDGMKHILTDWAAFEAYGRNSLKGYGKKRR